LRIKAKPAEGRAFEKLFNEYVRPLTLYAMQFVGEHEVAEDVVQDVFLYIYEKRDVVPVSEHKEHFLYSLVRNRCLNRLEYQKIRRENNPASHGFFNQHPEDPFEIVSVMEFENKYLQIVENLPHKYRKVFEASRFDGKTNQEIADESGFSKRTVETYISHVLRILRKKLKRYLPLILWLLCSALNF
jgi:RNA polymerase sigma-70 factor (family 1)